MFVPFKTTRGRDSTEFLVLCSLHHLKVFPNISSETFLQFVLTSTYPTNWKWRTDYCLPECLFNVIQNLSSPLNFLFSQLNDPRLLSLCLQVVFQSFDLPAFLWSLSNNSACPLNCALKPHNNCLGKPPMLQVSLLLERDWTCTPWPGISIFLGFSFPHFQQAGTMKQSLQHLVWPLSIACYSVKYRLATLTEAKFPTSWGGIYWGLQDLTLCPRSCAWPQEVPENSLLAKPSLHFL